MNQPCRFGSNCNRADCPFMHSGDRQRSEPQQLDQAITSFPYPTPPLGQRLAYTPDAYSHAVNSHLRPSQTIPPPNYVLQQPQHVAKVPHSGYTQNMMPGPSYTSQIRAAPHLRPGFVPVYGAQGNVRIPVSASHRGTRGPVSMSHGNAHGPVPISHVNMRGPVRSSHGSMGRHIAVPRENLGRPITVSHANMGGPVSVMSHENMSGVVPLSHRTVPMSRGNFTRGNLGRPTSLSMSQDRLRGPAARSMRVEAGRVGLPGTDDSWKDEWVADSRHCKCCEGYIYRCKKQEVMCHSDSCYCSTLLLESLSLNDRNPRPPSSSSQYPPAYQRLSSSRPSYPPLTSSPYPLPSSASQPTSMRPQYSQHPQHPSQQSQQYPQRSQLYLPQHQQYSQHTRYPPQLDRPL